MNFLTNGKVQFTDFFELCYHLFTEMGLSINQNQYLYDQDNGIEIRYKDKYIKASVQPVQLYAGRTDIIFDPAHNYNMMVSLFGYYIDKLSYDPEKKFGFIAQYIEDENEDRERQRFVVKTNQGDIYSQYYHNLYLAYIEIIFIIGDNFIPDLSNFDATEF